MFRKKKTEYALEQIWKSESFVETTGYAFSNYLNQNEDQQKPIFRQLQSRGPAQIEILGNLAFRNHDFLLKGETLPIVGDEVSLDQWRSDFKKFRETQFQHPSYLLGLSQRAKDWKNYITYQFAHGSFLHLLGNMFFLIVFGAFIEMTFGSFVFLLLYIISGMLAAVGFVFWSGIGYSPLIGASGAVSGLMAFVGYMYRNKNITCAYIVLPFQKLFGIIYLPGWIIFLLWLLTDVAGLLSSFSEFGGVAHSAHLGGAFGALVAAVVLEKYLNQTAHSFAQEPMLEEPEEEF